MHVCYISLYHIICDIIDLPYVYIYCHTTLHNLEVPFSSGAGVQCVYLYTKVGIDRMDKVAKQLDKGRRRKTWQPRDEAEVYTLGNSRWNPKMKVHKWWIFHGYVSLQEFNSLNIG